MMPHSEHVLLLPSDDTAVSASAEMYARIEMAPVPLYGLTASGACACGSAACGARGKHPIGNAWQKRATCDVDDVRDRFRNHTGNIGIYLGINGLVGIDADGEIGLAVAATLGIPPTLTAQTGSQKGAHYFLKFAPHHDQSAVTDRRVAPGLDIKVRGQFVAAPSRHASGGVYRWTENLPIATLPDDIYEKIKKHQKQSFNPPSGTLETLEGLEKRARAYLDKIPPAISGAGGHDQAFAAARALAGFLVKGLSETSCLRLLSEYNSTCKPPWTDAELAHKWRDAKAADHKPQIKDRPKLHIVSNFTSKPGGGGGSGGGDSGNGGGSSGDVDWNAELQYIYGKNKTKLDSHMDNVIRILQLSPDWRGRISFDDFRARIVVTNPPWDQYHKPTSRTSYWTDEDTTRLCSYMRRTFIQFDFHPTVADCERAVAVVAQSHTFHPIRDYLDGLKWDGQPRLAAWLSTYLGAPATPYSSLVGPWWLISAVARIYVPGCKVDTVPILEGDQGLRKSMALESLAGTEYYNDTPIDLGSRDAYTAIQGCWFVELAELESLMRVDASRSKAFFSSKCDRFRRVYARHETEEKRQCIFVGTVNLNVYLNDPTGGRRFWPIPCSDINVYTIRRDRDQLWAEAVHEYRAGRKWYAETEEEKALLVVQQASRTQEDAWEGPVAAWLAARAGTQVTSGDILHGALHLDCKDWTKPNQTRVGILVTTRLGWQKRRVRNGSFLTWVYEAPTEMPSNVE